MDDETHVLGVRSGCLYSHLRPHEQPPCSSSDLITFLTRLVPYSLPLLRRLQLSPINEESLIVSVGLPIHTLASGTESERIARQAKQHAADPATIQPDQLWTLALIHRHGHPSTEIWFFNSLELAHGHASHEKEAQSAEMKPEKLSLPFTEEVQKHATLQLATVLSHVPVTSRQEGVDLFQQCKTFGSPGSLAGNVHSTVAALLAHAGLIVYTSPPYGHYVYAAVVDAKGTIPDASAEGLPGGLIWSTIQPSDHADVMAVNKIVRSAATIAYLPSAAIRRVQPNDDGSPGKAVAFGFASGDGSLRTLHVDPDFRRKGLAKAVVKRLLNSGVFAPPKQGVFSASREVYEEIEEPQPLAYSSVEKSNIASIKTFEGVGATWRWDVYWAWLDLDKATRMLKSG
ncbi:hypothetical protein CC79DRAFT_1367015 [Sarocladium strictum]